MFGKFFSRIDANKAAAMFQNELQQFLLYHEAQGHSPRTATWYAQMINTYIRYIERKKLRLAEAVAPETIEAYLAAQRKLHAPRTVDGRYRALQAFFNWLVERDKLQDHPSPFAKLKRPKIPTRRPNRVTLEEYQQLIASVGNYTWLDYRDKAIIATLFQTGVRIGELAALTVPHVDLEHRVITVIGKGNKERHVPFTDAVKRAIFAYLMSRPPWAGPELWLAANGALRVQGVLTGNGVRKVIYRRCEEAGIRKLNPHAFRHGFATALLNHGADLSSISKLMGHSSTAITEQVYAEWEQEGLRGEYERAWKATEIDS